MVETVINTDSSNGKVEQEHNEYVINSVPFDPNDIVVDTFRYSIFQVIDYLEHEDITTDREFQRSSDLWNITKKSRFIESILLKLPVPAFYFATNDDNSWQIIDGLQRISTIKNFLIDKTLQLENLEFLKIYNGYYYDDLPLSIQRRIKIYAITANILGRGTPDVVKYNIFNRINDLKLTSQEMRHALYQGKAADLVGELVKISTPEGTTFIQATNGKIKSDRMQDRDFANRFIAFYLIPFTQYKPDLNSFLGEGMAKINRLSDEEIEKLKADFRKAMDMAYTIFGNDAFRKRFHKHDKRKPINKVLFEILSVSFAKLSEEDTLLLIDRKEEFRSAFIELHHSDDFLQSISSGTAQSARVTKRFEAINSIIQETLNQA